jgi:glycosyltransferase involved in cell wall biosynthesis
MSDISVVVPTCDRPGRLLSLLRDLGRSALAPREIIVVDASDRPLGPVDLAPFGDRLRYLTAEKSVCAQRNRGIREATGTWIFLCDDDIEVPPDYLTTLMAHVAAHPEAGAVSGLILEEVGGRWVSQHPISSWPALLWSWIFHLGIWGEIRCHGFPGDWLATHYRSRGNHISSAGWPVLTDFSAPFFKTPVYPLGASLVRRDWLLQSPFDERLDRRGYGDNYGVAIGFPDQGIHVVTAASVRHHKEQAERPPAPIGYSKRILALDLFLSSHHGRAVGRRGWLLWSLLGNTLLHAGTGNREMCWASLKTLSVVLARQNPYLPRGI